MAKERQLDFTDYLIWVLVPQIITADENLSYYYDFDQSHGEFKKAFEDLQIDWMWRPVSNENYKRIIESIIKDSGKKIPIVFNLCDGDETNGIPGIEVIKLLDHLNITYTGADEYFYEVTTSKIIMKELFATGEVPTPAWKVVSKLTAGNLFQQLHAPVIIKPAVSAGSMGVGIRSVVHDEAALQKQVLLLQQGYHGWHISDGGIIAEEFIAGPEFTSLIVGNSEDPDNCIVYPPIERVFHVNLPEAEKFLSFERLWEIYEEEKSMNDGEDFYTYHSPNTSLIKEINDISLAAYASVKGSGYGRIDLRMDKDSKKIYVLEVNAQCGLSEDENYTSIGAILRLSNNSFSNLVAQIICLAIERKGFAKYDELMQKK